MIRSSSNLLHSTGTVSSTACSFRDFLIPSSLNRIVCLIDRYVCKLMFQNCSQSHLPASFQVFPRHNVTAFKGVVEIGHVDGLQKRALSKKRTSWMVFLVSTYNGWDFVGVVHAHASTSNTGTHVDHHEIVFLQSQRHWLVQK